MKKPIKKSAIIYTRFSPRRDADKCESLDTQFEMCEFHCKLHDMTVIGNYEDKALSGKEASNRPGLQNAIGHAIRTKATLVCYSLDRLARDTRDALTLAERLEKGKADLCFIKEAVDTKTPIGKCFFTIVAAMAELERNKISQRTSDAMKRHQNTGRRMTSKGKLPYGQRIDPNDDTRVVPDAYEKKVIAQIMWMRKDGWDGVEEARGLTYRQIAAELTENGYIPRRTTRIFQDKRIECEGKWHFGTIRNIIHRQEQDLF